MSTAARYVPNYSIDDYQQWEGDWELWDGIAVSMSPAPFGKHQAIAAEILFELMRCIKETNCDATAFAEMDWIINSSTVVRPDVMIVCRGAPDRHVESPPALAVEIVSESSMMRDTVFKRDLYGGEGLSNYLLVDPIQRQILLYRQTTDWLAESVHDIVHLDLCENCGLDLNFGKLFDIIPPA